MIYPYGLTVPAAAMARNKGGPAAGGIRNACSIAATQATGGTRGSSGRK